MYFSYLGNNVQQTLEEPARFVNVPDAANKRVMFYSGTQFGKANISSASPLGLGWVHAKGEYKLLQNGTPRETSNVLPKLVNIRDIERNRVLFHDGTTFMAYPLTPPASALCQSGGSQAVRRGNDEADKAEDENDSGSGDEHNSQSGVEHDSDEDGDGSSDEDGNFQVTRPSRP
jgi:hypothetical protein